MYSSRKRARTPYGGTAQRKAYWASTKFNRLHPWPTWGAARIMRGSNMSRSVFGSDFRHADATQRMNRKQTGFTGRGAYYGNLAGRTAAGMLGYGSSAQQIAGDLGSRAENWVINKGIGALQAYVGRGAYKMQGEKHTTNALINSVNPNVQYSTEPDTGAIMVTRSEFIKEITPSATGFETALLAPLNPGMSEAFEWVAQIAQFYEQYEFIQMFYEFKSTIPTGNNSASGTVLITPLMTGSAPYGDKMSMSFAQGFVSGGVNHHLLCGVECHPDKIYGGSVKRVRVGDVGSDLINYDIGQIQVATQDCTPNLSVGELWVHFTVKLSQPRFGAVSNVDSAPAAETYFFETGGSIVHTAGAVASQTSTNLFGLGTVAKMATANDSGVNLIDQVFSMGLLQNAANYTSQLYVGESGSAFNAGATFLKFLNPSQAGKRFKCVLTFPVKAGTYSLATPISYLPLILGVGGIKLCSSQSTTWYTVQDFAGPASQNVVTMATTTVTVGSGYWADLKMVFYIDVVEVGSGSGLLLQVGGALGTCSTAFPSQLMLEQVARDDADFEVHTFEAR